MTKRKASLGLQNLSEESAVHKEEVIANSSTSIPQTTLPKQRKKQTIPIYVDPLLHDALHVIAFSERHKKTTFQSLFMEALDLLLKQRGLPTVAELASGERTINP